MLWISCTAIVLIAGFFTLRPLFRASAGNPDMELWAETELDRLLARKNVIYRNLRDLEMEHRMGRLSDRDFQQLASGYKGEASSILQRLDQLNTLEDPDERIEKDIAARKSERSGSGKRGRARCPSCGSETASGKKFCADCGQRL